MQRTTRECCKMRAARAAHLFFFVRPIRFLIDDVNVVFFDVVDAEAHKWISCLVLYSIKRNSAFITTFVISPIRWETFLYNMTHMLWKLTDFLLLDESENKTIEIKMIKKKKIYIYVMASILIVAFGGMLFHLNPKGKVSFRSWITTGRSKQRDETNQNYQQ